MILLVDAHHTAQCKSVGDDVFGQGCGSKLAWQLVMMFSGKGGPANWRGIQENTKYR